MGPSFSLTSVLLTELLKLELVLPLLESLTQAKLPSLLSQLLWLVSWVSMVLSLLYSSTPLSLRVTMDHTVKDTKSFLEVSAVDSAPSLSGLAIGVAGDAGVRAYAQTDAIFVGMILILIFAECIGLYGMIIAIILVSSG